MTNTRGVLYGRAKKQKEQNRVLAERFLAGESLHSLAAELKTDLVGVTRKIHRTVPSPASVEFERLAAIARPPIKGTVRIFAPGPKRWTAKVDAADFHWITGLVWTVNDAGYLRNVGTNTRLHRVLMQAPEDKFVDHKNGDRRDNRRENLRLTDKAGNCRNMHSTKRTRRGQFKGVTTNFQCGRLRYVARISVGKDANGKERKFTGSLRLTEAEAARDYDRLALEHFGEFAATNFPRSDYVVAKEEQPQ